MQKNNTMMQMLMQMMMQGYKSGGRCVERMC